ncbi:hypothetical protein [Streptomyces sp. bgisy100]|uniref:hypothetical protein n=1 Tax=Streptomyces sp. bgisy100 TaxID=3413783 RepID=UPI003D72996B
MTESLLIKCDLCGCLVDSATLRVRDFWIGDRDSALRRITHVVCADPPACYARTRNPDHWRQVGAVVPVGQEPGEGALLGRCLLCDTAASADALDVRRVRDDTGWLEEVVCRDVEACGRRQQISTRIELPPL